MCKECFFACFEIEIHETIARGNLFKPGMKVAIGASGGKGKFPIPFHVSFDSFSCIFRFLFFSSFDSHSSHSSIPILFLLLTPLCHCVVFIEAHNRSLNCMRLDCENFLFSNSTFSPLVSLYNTFPFIPLILSNHSLLSFLLSFFLFLIFLLFFEREREMKLELSTPFSKTSCYHFFRVNNLCVLIMIFIPTFLFH